MNIRQDLRRDRQTLGRLLRSSGKAELHDRSAELRSCGRQHDRPIVAGQSKSTAKIRNKCRNGLRVIKVGLRGRCDNGERRLDIAGFQTMGNKDAAIGFDHDGAERVMAAMRRNGPRTRKGNRDQQHRQCAHFDHLSGAGGGTGTVSSEFGSTFRSESRIRSRVSAGVSIPSVLGSMRPAKILFDRSASAVSHSGSISARASVFGVTYCQVTFF